MEYQPQKTTLKIHFFAGINNKNHWIMVLMKTWISPLKKLMNFVNSKRGFNAYFILNGRV